MAVRPPDTVLDAVAGAVAAGRDVRDGVRWEPPGHWHLTLQFLGPVRRLAPVTRALGETAAQCGRFRFQLGGAGAFPTAKRARVLWVGAAEGHPQMVHLAGAVAAALGAAGYEAERRSFRPHLTLARLKVPGDVGAVLAAIGPGPVGPDFTVGAFVLYQSRLSPQGAAYTALESFPLGDA